MMRKKITKIEKDLKALNKWLVGDKKETKKKQLKKLLKKSKEKNDLLKKCERVNAMMTEPIPPKIKNGIFRLTHVITF